MKFIWCIVLTIFIGLEPGAQARLVFSSEDVVQTDSAFVLDESNDFDDVVLQFGADVNAAMSYDRLNNKFDLNRFLQSTEALMSDEFDNTSGAIINIDWNEANQQTITLNQVGHTINFSNFTPGQLLRLVTCQDGTGGRTVATWDASVTWRAGNAPVLTATANKCDVISFITTEARGSTEVLGNSVPNF